MAVNRPQKGYLFTRPETGKQNSPFDLRWEHMCGGNNSFATLRMPSHDQELVTLELRINFSV